jgi:hypothetical protein
MAACMNDFRDGQYGEIIPVTVAPSGINRVQLLKPVIDDIIQHPDLQLIGLGISLSLLCVV